MDLKKQIIFEFQQTVLTAQVPNELKRALRYHERVPLFIDNLYREISQSKIKFTPEQIAQVVNDLTLIYINCVKRMADEKYMSDIERARLQAAKDKQKEFDDFADKVNDPSTTKIELTNEGFEIETSETKVEV